VALQRLGKYDAQRSDGRNRLEKTHGGAEVFDYFNEFPEHGEIFNGAMTDMSVATAPVVVEAYDFSGIETLADIAGGHGICSRKF
jgi:hypothetical protein